VHIPAFCAALQVRATVRVKVRVRARARV